MLKWKSLAALSIFTCTAAFAADGIRLGEPQYGGNGCPQGSASATISPDGSQLSVLFDRYQVEAGNQVGKRLDRKSCNIAIPVHVPQGYSISIFQVDYRGFNSLPSGARSQFNVEYFFAGSVGPKYQKNFYGPIDQDYTLSNTLMASALVWSPCGQTVNLRTNSSMYTTTNNRGEQALSTVDSLDIDAGIIYQIQWRRCSI